MAALQQSVQVANARETEQSAVESCIISSVTLPVCHGEAENHSRHGKFWTKWGEGGSLPQLRFFLVPCLLMAEILSELLKLSLAFEKVRKNIVIMRKCIKIRHIVNTIQIF